MVRNDETASSIEARNAAILESALDCIITMDHEGKIAQFNPAAERTFGYKRQDVIGRELAGLIIPPALRDRHRSGLAHFTGTGDSTILNRRIEINAIRSDGTEFPVELAVTRINTAGPPTFTAYLRDITERKQAAEDLRKVREELEARVKQRTVELTGANQALELEVGERTRAQTEAQQAKDVAESANKAKSEFLANMSHEIRTPMAAILGYADRMLEPHQQPSDRLDCINTIRRNGEHLLLLINDILDLAKIEAGEMTVEKIRCSPAAIIADVASIMRVKAVEKRLTFEASVAGAIPTEIEADPTRLKQILINLVGNAIKFTETGSVRIIARLLDPPDSANPRLLFEVVDSGIGMSTEELSRLFRPFSQADSSTTRRFGGTGLGLSISRHFARMLGGDLIVDSSSGSGSQFFLTVPTGPLAGITLTDTFTESMEQAPAAKQGETTRRLHGRILLADDGRENRDLLSHYLQQAGVEVIQAENGVVAVEKALAASAAGAPFDLIFMDMQMPVLDGYSATAKLRSKGYSAPIVALTAHAMATDREKCLMSGCTDYLSKPARKPQLLEMAARYLSSTDAPPTLKSDVSDEVVMMFLDTFVAELPANVRRLNHLLDEGNLADLLKIAHRLKGSAGLYGFMSITALAGNLEIGLEQKQALETTTKQVHGLIELIRSVEGYSHIIESSTGALTHS